MAQYKDVPLPVSVRELKVDDGDYAALPPIDLINMLEQIFIINHFEHAVLALKEEDLVHGPVHTGVGQEAIAAGIGCSLAKSDMICSTHRAHHHYLGKVLSYLIPEDYNAAEFGLNDKMLESIKVLLAEIMGLYPGCCHGRGGSMHLREREAGIIGTNAIVGGGIAMSAGAAWAEKLKGGDNTVVSIFGDGACNQGVLMEAANMAALWKCPIIYFVENNLYAVGTSVDNATALSHLAYRGVGFPAESIIIDGQDPVAVYFAIREAKKLLKEKEIPVFIEAKTYRHYHHAGITPGSSFGYRTKDEEEKWQETDTLQWYPEKLQKLGVCSQEQISRIEQKAREAVDTVVEFCTTLDNGRRSVKVDLWPETVSVVDGVRSDGREFNNVRFSAVDNFNEFREIKYVEAISETITRRMDQDETIVVFGEEVTSFGGGAYQATKGIPAKYPDRIFNTPISEAGFVGMGLGLAMEGMKPIVEIMFPDFALVAGDQLFNQAGKVRHIYGGELDVPLVVRTRIAIGCGYGAQHSMDPSGLIAMFPGWRIVAPSTAFDYIGLMNSALKSADPVFIIEHHELYNEKGEVPVDNLDYFIEFGSARIRKSGADVTVISYLNGLRKTLQVAQRLGSEGPDMEVIDLRTLDYAGIDYNTIRRSIKKTGRAIIVEEAPRSAGIGSRIADEIQRRFFDYLDAPVKVVASKDVSNPVSRAMESEAILDTEELMMALIET